MAVTPTKDTYTEFDRAYDYFNAALFTGKLPPCGQIITDEIALNPDRFAERSMAETLSSTKCVTSSSTISARPRAAAITTRNGPA
jgi:hypothetical protein